MQRRLALILGWAWPFVVAAVGVAVSASGAHIGDPEVLLLLSASFLGAPAVIVTAGGWLPQGWPHGLRVVVALMAASPLVVVEVWLAFVAFMVADVHVGRGWIE